jgi:hypothetical protein
MTGTGEAGQTRLPGRMTRSHRRERDTGHPRHDAPRAEAHDPDEEPDQELDAVNRLMGFLRQGSEP